MRRSAKDNSTPASSQHEERLRDEAPVILPTHNVAAFIRHLAELHGVEYVETAADKIARAVTRLSGDDIEVDDIEDLAVALCRGQVITQIQMLELIGSHVREKQECLNVDSGASGDARLGNPIY